MKHGAVDRGRARPDVQTLLEHLRPADEIAGMPVSQRDFAPRGRDIEDLDPTALDQIDAVLRTALAKQLRATVEHLALSGTQHTRLLGFGQSPEQWRRTAALRSAVGHQQRAELGLSALAIARRTCPLWWLILAHHGSAQSPRL